ncbi:MAG TPA: portal protein [Campylobacteraceae bacterium]|nr:portal protein [Campylobacteraceae bacterium]
MQSYASWIVIRRLRIPLIVIILTFAVSILGMMMIPGRDDQGNLYHLNFFDAFYFVSYMASTIGFGESPYAFTYPQKLWVSFSIYLTVIGWFYGIGTIVALIQDKVLSEEIARAKFMKDIREMDAPFILIFGYNEVTKNLINRLSARYQRMVVIDKDKDKIDALKLENHQPYIPAFYGDLLDIETLKMAGIREKQCKYAVILFENEYKNTQLAMMCRYLNNGVRLIVRSNTLQNGEYLRRVGVDYVENPFRVISHRLYRALTAPSLWVLEMWIHGHPLRVLKREKVPKGKFVIYGYGRMGAALEKGLKKAGVEYVFIDARDLFADQERIEKIFSEEKMEERLVEAGIDDAAVIVAGTRNDIVNLAVIMLARKHNPSIYTVARENSLTDLSVFKAAAIDRNYILEQIVADKAFNHLAMPLANIFIKQLNDKDEAWGCALVERIRNKMGEKSHLCEIVIDHSHAYALSQKLQEGVRVTLQVLKRSRESYTRENPLLFLLVRRGDEVILLPEDDFVVEPGDEMLVVCNDESENDLAYILNNYYELYYAMHGTEEIPGLLGGLMKNQAGSDIISSKAL